MIFDKNAFVIEEKTIGGESVRYRAWKNIPYVEKPAVQEFQQLNLFAPAVYFEGGSINGYSLETAPVFVPNSVGGYMPGQLDEPGTDHFRPEEANTIFRALQHGYVVAAPAVRGRVQPTGKAPACIVDYKAAVRWLHYFADELPGDESKIITNGTSAGGALSSLMGATGDHPDYRPYLEVIGALDASDAVFAASCYCPITNLDHADMAYEWEFAGVYEYHRMAMEMNEGGRPSFTPEDGEMTDAQKALSDRLAAAFPAYVNSFDLKDETRTPLTLDENGNGSFKSHIEKIVIESAQKALDNGADLTEKGWLTVENGQATAMDFTGWVRDITRMKTAPAFDDVTMGSPENHLFGNDEIEFRHFTPFSAAHSEKGGVLAPHELIKMLNPMNYIADPAAKTARYWRIRHGECDRDTSLVISAILTLKLREQGISVDYHSPWNTPHSGDYDLDELFAWIDSICR